MAVKRPADTTNTESTDAFPAGTELVPGTEINVLAAPSRDAQGNVVPAPYVYLGDKDAIVGHAHEQLVAQAASAAEMAAILAGEPAPDAQDVEGFRSQAEAEVDAAHVEIPPGSAQSAISRPEGLPVANEARSGSSVAPPEVV